MQNQPANLKIMDKVPSRETLQRLIDMDSIDTVQILLEKWGHILKFSLAKDSDGKYILRKTLSNGEAWLEKFITVDEETIAMKENALKASKYDYEVLVFGETGTGKELIAKSQIGDKKGYIRVANCAGFPSELIESELFGYVAGAFTGAIKTTDGLMTAASDGILFLDEVGELPMQVQAKLLRAIQEKSIRKVGAKTEEKINCKFVFASNRSIPLMVEQGLFRKDLYARIGTIELDIKPLVERKADIVPIIESLDGGKEFLEWAIKAYGGLESVLDCLDLSLNVRSLQQQVIRYKVLGKI